MLFYQVERTRPWTMLLTGVVVALASAPALCGDVPAFNLRTIPATPVAGEPFALTLTAPFCHVFWSESPLDRVVEVVGSTVRVTVEYTAPPFGNGGCDASMTRTMTWSIAPLDAGSYTLEFVGDDPIGGGTHEIEQIPLTVAPASQGVRVVPAMQTWGSTLLVLSLLAAAIFGIRRARD